MENSKISEPVVYQPCYWCGADRTPDELVCISGADIQGFDLWLCEDCYNDLKEINK